MATSRTDPLVAYRGRQRWVQSVERLVLPDSAMTKNPLRKEGVYLITGGMGNLGLTIATYLAQHYQARLALLGRTKFPQRAEWHAWLATHDQHDATSAKICTIQRLEEMGSQVLIIEADVADSSQMTLAMKQIDHQFGELHGVIYAAGATRGRSMYRPMEEIDHVLSEEQFRTKVYGLFVLEELLRDRGVDFCVLFSSNSALLGGLGFTAYSAVNLFMNAFTHKHNQHEKTPWLSINWDIWQQATHEKELEQFSAFHTGIQHDSMSTEEGIQAFEQALTLLTLNEILISSTNLQVRFDLWIKQKSTPVQVETQRSPRPTHERPSLTNPYVEPHNTVEQRLVDIWELLLGVSPIGIHDNFFELGGHSLLATQVAIYIQNTFSVKVPLQALFETPVIADLAPLILHELASRTDEQLLSWIEQLSDDDIEVSEKN